MAIQVRIRKSASPAVGWLIMLIGGAAFVVAIYLFISTNQFLSHATNTTGSVVEVLKKEKHGSGKHTGRTRVSYYPVFVFHDLHQKEWKVTSSAGGNPPAFEVGEVIQVYYDQANPEEARIGSFFSLWGASLIVGFIGMVFEGVGFAVVFLRKD
jgi:hypothetical protein